MTATGTTPPLPPVPARCEACGKGLGVLNPKGRRQRFCDSRCRSAARRQRDAQRLRDPTALPFPTAVRAAISNSGETLRVLAAQLEDAGYPLSPTTLSHWGNGRSLPLTDTHTWERLFALERLSWVPTGSLIRALLNTPDPRRRRIPSTAGPLPPGGPPGHSTTARASRLLLQRIHTLFGWNPHTLVQTARTKHHVLDHRRQPVRSNITITVAAVTGTVDRYWHVHTADPAPSTVTAGHGCVRRTVLDTIPPIRVTSDTTRRLTATELILTQPVPAGTEHTFSFTVHHPTTDPDTGCGDGDGVDAVPVPAELWTPVLNPALRKLSIGIAFDPATRPRQVRRVRWPLHPIAAQPEITTIPVQDDGTSEPILLALPAPGWHGYQWHQPTTGQH